MKNRVSSFPAEAARPWHRQRWPWLLIAGPLAVVVASLASAWIALRSDDGLVAQDYYKQGLLINRKLPQAAQATGRSPGASIAVETGRQLHVRLREVSIAPSRLQLTFIRPGDRASEQRVELARNSDGEWVGALPALGSGRWIVALASESWRLPVTTFAGAFTRLELGAASGEQF
jgi:uncharacterized protein